MHEDTEDWSTPITQAQVQHTMDTYAIGTLPVTSVLTLPYLACAALLSPAVDAPCWPTRHLGEATGGGATETGILCRARSGAQLLCALVPVVPAVGADVGGRDSGGAQAVPRVRWAHPLWQGARAWVRLRGTLQQRLRACVHVTSTDSVSEQLLVKTDCGVELRLMPSAPHC